LDKNGPEMTEVDDLRKQLMKQQIVLLELSEKEKENF
jgi:hypothetical protein